MANKRLNDSSNNLLYLIDFGMSKPLINVPDKTLLKKGYKFEGSLWFASFNQLNFKSNYFINLIHYSPNKERWFNIIVLYIDIFAIRIFTLDETLLKRLLYN